MDDVSPPPFTTENLSQNITETVIANMSPSLMQSFFGECKTIARECKGYNFPFRFFFFHHHMSL